MTFVDLVFPAFLFLVGMSIPLALGGRLDKGQSLWRIIGHVAGRTLSLLAVGILMVHETPDTAVLGWAGDWWCVLMYLSAIAAFCSLAPHPTGPEARKEFCRKLSLGVRVAGLAALVWLAFAFRGARGQRIITLVPLSLDTGWYGILGLIGWAYLVTSAIFLVFRGHRTAILGCLILLMCLFVADRKGLFEGFWLDRIVGIGGTLGSLPAIAAGGLLLGTMLTAPDMTTLGARTRFIFWFVAGCARPCSCCSGLTVSARTARRLRGAFGPAPSRPSCGMDCTWFRMCGRWSSFRGPWRWRGKTCCWLT